MTGGEYWDGALFVYHSTIANGAGGAGNQSYIVSVSEGSEMEVLYGIFINGDTVDRDCRVTIDDGTNTLTRLAREAALSAGIEMPFPIAGAVDSGTDPYGAGRGRPMIAGPLRITALGTAIAASQDTTFGLVGRFRGAVPTVVEAGASTPTITVNTERVA